MQPRSSGGSGVKDKDIFALHKNCLVELVDDNYESDLRKAKNKT